MTTTAIDRALASDFAASSETVPTAWYDLIDSGKRSELIALWAAWSSGTNTSLMTNYPSARSLARFIREEELTSLTTKPTIDTIVRDLNTLMGP